MRRLLFVLGMVGLAVGAGACGGSSEISTGGGGSTTTATDGGGGEGGADAAGGTGGGGAGTTGSTTSSDGGGGAGGAPVKCEGKTGALGDWNIGIMWDGATRNADVHVPEKYDPTVPAMLVLDFHGYMSNAGQQELLSKMNAASDERGFIAVHPSGVGSSWNGGKCCGTAASQELDDVGFVSALLDELEEEYCVDPKRVFATGMSNGGFLSNRLGCELSDRIAAIAPVAGVLGVELEDCQPGRKVPVMHFHGTDDTLVPYTGGGLYDFPSVEQSVERWRDIDGCGPNLEVVFDQGDSQCLSAAGCAEGTEVILCTVDGGGHTWPGGTPVPWLGKTTTDLDATNAMLDFFEKHPMP